MFDYLKKMIFGASKTESKTLNFYQYKFLRYKEERNKKYPLNLESVHVPCVKDMISVILPVYNGADVIAQSIESVLCQTYTNFEFIIINDGSKDNTLEIVKSYAEKDSRIRVLDQENRKIPRTLSRGFREAKGEFYTWTSADNVMDKDFLARMVNDLKAKPNTGMIYGNMRLIDAKGKKLKRHGWYEFPMGCGNVIFPDNAYELNTYANNTIGAAFMYRAAAAEVLGCYSSFKHTLEDYDYWMRMNSLLELRHTDFIDPVYSYRWHDNSLTAKDAELGITKNRYKLMVLDDFRRDFYLTPLMWCVESDSSNSAAASEFKRIAENAGHLVVDEKDFADMFFGDGICGVCHVSFGGDITYTAVPGGSFKICVNCRDENKDNKFDIFASLKKGEAGYIGDAPEYDFDDIQTMFSFIDAKVKNDILYRLEEKIETEQKYEKKLSVILCTHKLSPVLDQCMEALCTQNAQKSDYEIVFVNNNFRDSQIKEFVQEKAKKYPDVDISYITAPVKGLSYARNSGLWAAKGEILLYVDDDAVANSDIVNETLKGFEKDADFGVIGGHVKLVIPESAKAVVTEKTIGLWSDLEIKGKEIREAKDYGEFPYGANFAVRAQCLRQIGGFRTAYGRVGNNFGGGEETLVCFMMGEINKKVGLNPNSLVEHRVSEGRFNTEHIEKTAYAGILTQYCLRRDLYAPSDWTDLNVQERAQAAERSAKKEKEGSPDYVYYKAVSKAFRDVLLKRQDDYAYLKRNRAGANGEK